MSLILSGTDGLSDVDGTAATPAIRGTDANTGIFFPAADTIAFAEGGAECARFDTSGNLVVGATATRGTYKLDIRSDTSIALGSNATYYGTIGYSAGTGLMSLAAESGGGINFLSGATERARIDSSGNWLVGTASASGAGASSGLQVINFNGAAGNGLYMSDTRTSAGNDNAVIFGRGATYVGKIETSLTTTSYISASDYRLKNVTGNLTGYKERLMSLQPKQGTWIVDGSEFRGFLAHDFAGLYPKSVSGEKDAVDANGKPMMQGMQASSSEVMADLVALIQEQQALITQLTARITALESA